MKKLDPAVILALAMLVLTLAVMGLLLASRSCIKETSSFFTELSDIAADAGSHYDYEFGEVQALPPAEYVAFEDLVRATDLGTGVTVGMSESEVRRVLGNPFTSARIDPSRVQLMYNLPYGCEGPGEKQRLRSRGGLKAMVNMAMIAVTIRRGAVESLDISFVAEDARNGWPFLTLGKAQLADCTVDDVREYFGEPADSAEHAYDTWYFRMAESIGPDEEEAGVEEEVTGSRVAVKVDYYQDNDVDYVYEVELALP